ncbi:hypothetical protein P154DRAFT_557648 [Amniculicola lignicola CBS 123094]|uniref:Rhodopsin domain-containing protein n=1 Tax=Amniculicola lignicola CBS 123094 TaxID=1392246 RepID=A0A6A5W0E9_9PLEO|nr:hypothetical protein P154DRAFT_557648 [Amniculicola lignicola CBS 123094]
MDPSKLPPAQYIPGRQAAIDHAGRIDKKPFVISIGIFFGTAILSVCLRIGIRIFGGRRIRWDDILVILAAVFLTVAFGLLLKLLDTLYLIEAMNKKTAIPFREDIPNILELGKWAAVFATMNWSAVYVVKFAFMYFFHTLVVGLSKRIGRFFWTTLGILIVCWIYTVCNAFIICPHFGADAAKCSTNPKQHDRSLAGNILVACVDIICDALIVAIPIVVLNKSMMPFSQKVSLAAMLGLSVAMILCAFVRLIGSVTDTRKDGSGTAPVWATYWAIMEGCIAVIMTSVIVIRGVFISTLISDDRRKQESIMQRFGRRLLSTLRLSGSSGRSGRSGRKDHGPGPSAPRIGTQGLTRGTLHGVRTFISGGKRKSATQDDMLKSGDTAFILEDMDYHNIRRNEATRPTGTPESSHPAPAPPVATLPGKAL